MESRNLLYLSIAVLVTVLAVSAEELDNKVGELTVYFHSLPIEIHKDRL